MPRSSATTGVRRSARRGRRGVLDEDLVTNEPITVVLSEKGWMRAAKGHEADPRELSSYKGGDRLRRFRPRPDQRYAGLPGLHRKRPTRLRRTRCPRRAARASRSPAASSRPPARATSAW